MGYLIFGLVVGIVAGFSLCMHAYGIPYIERTWAGYAERRRDIRAMCSWHRRYH